MHTQKVLDATTSSLLLVPYSNKRMALVVAGPITNRITLSFVNPAVLSQGIRLYPSAAPFSLNWHQHGTMVHGPIWIICNVAGETIGVWESFLEDE